MACPSACGRPVQRALGTRTGAPVQSHTHPYYGQTGSTTSHQSKVSGNGFTKYVQLIPHKTIVVSVYDIYTSSK